MIEGTAFAVAGNVVLTCAHVLDQRIDELTASRRAYSRLHEVGHLALSAPEVDHAIPVPFSGSLSAYTADDDDQPTDWLTSLICDGSTQSGQLFESLAEGIPSTLQLPTWNTRTFAGITAETSFGGGGAQAATEALAVWDPEPPAPAPSQVIFHVPVGAGALLVDSWAAMVRVIDSVLAALRLMRLRVRTGLGRRFKIVAFVLAILAACRHYGHRAEPDDHASLFIRRHLMSMGGCLPA
jgi:hypothetical protein